MKLRIGAVLALAALATMVAAQESGDDPTVLIKVGDEGLVVERPSLWRAGAGPTILLHFIGSADGFPQFTAMAEPEAALGDDATPEYVREAVGEMFAVIAADDQLLEAGWTEINDIEVHSSLAIRDSLAGPIQRRRVLLVCAGVPYVLMWAHHADRYGEVVSSSRSASPRWHRGWAPATSRLWARPSGTRLAASGQPIPRFAPRQPPATAASAHPESAGHRAGSVSSHQRIAA